MRRYGAYVAVFALGAVIGLAAIRLGGRNERSARHADVLTLLSTAPRPSRVEATPLMRAATRITPAVVNVDTLEEQSRTETYRGTPVETTLSKRGRSSGVIMSSDGYIITNEHVVAGAQIIRVTTSAGARLDARVVGTDLVTDLAVLKVDGTGLPFADLGDSDALRLGEEVLAIGNPMGVGITVTHGIVSAVERRNLTVSPTRALPRVIQTDAAINPGNSGGALADLDGRLVGINTAILSGSGGSVGIGFAVPVTVVRVVARRLIRSGLSSAAPPARPFMGLVLAEISREQAAEIGLPAGPGLLVAQVKPLTAAADAGIAKGSVIIAVDGRPVSNNGDVRAAVGRRNPGDRVTVRLWRRGLAPVDVKMTLGHRPESLGR